MFNLKLLGTAAGGGFPQWNCACSLCNEARRNASVVTPRLQLQGVCSSAGGEQFLINASPDLRVQIEAEPSLQPTPDRGRRNSPIAGIVLTSADLDQVLGLLMLREFQPLTIYATALVRRVLEANSFFRMLQRVPNQLNWTEIVPEEPFYLAADVKCTPIPLQGGLPYYAKASSAEEETSGHAGIGLILEMDGRQGSDRVRLAYTPSVPKIDDDLLAIYNSCDTILVDGTFWSDSELNSTHTGTPLSREIGHVPMDGEDGMIALLKDIGRPKKVFIHINNTNPVLDPRSAERKLAEASGWQIANDGWQWNS